MEEKKILLGIRGKITADGRLSEPLTEEEVVWLRHASNREKRCQDCGGEIQIIPGLFKDLSLRIDR